MNTAFIGIDPGKNGGISYICGESVESLPLTKSNINYVCSILKSTYGQNILAFVEKVHAMPGQGVTSMFNFGENFGYIKGVLDSLNIYTVLVTPQEWKKHFGLIKKDKKASIEKCKEIFTGINLYKTDRCRTENDGMAESLLIAEYGRGLYGSKN